MSRICLGCLNFGGTAESDRPWTLTEELSRPILREAIEAGINFFDTANSYSGGASEEILGRALADFARRDEVVVATKVYFPVRSGPNGSGLGRKAIMTEIDNSLRRLGTDYVDIYQIHRFDYDTPIEETLIALHDVVKAGKARYIGASSMFAWQFATMLHTAKANGWTRFSTMQNQLSLLYREEEREMMPLCRAEGVGLIPWSPLARGRLSRPWGVTTPRTEQDAIGKMLFDGTAEVDRAIVEAVTRVAKKRGMSQSQVALAWVLQTDGVAAPIIGASKPQQLREALSALTVELSKDDVDALEAPYTPHPVAGFW